MQFIPTRSERRPNTFTKIKSFLSVSFFHLRLMFEPVIRHTCRIKHAHWSQTRQFTHSSLKAQVFVGADCSWVYRIHKLDFKTVRFTAFLETEAVLNVAAVMVGSEVAWAVAGQCGGWGGAKGGRAEVTIALRPLRTSPRDHLPPHVFVFIF